MYECSQAHLCASTKHVKNKFKIKKNCNKKEKLCLCLWVSFDMGSASCWSCVKLLFSSVWAVFRNTFQPIQIHVKLHWSFTFHRLYQTTAVNGLWDTKRLRVCPHLLCEAKRSPSSRYTTLLLFENIFHDGLYCTFTTCYCEPLRSVKRGYLPTFCVLYDLQRLLRDLLSIHNCLLVSTTPLQRLLCSGECPTIAFSCELWLTHIMLRNSFKIQSF